MNQVLKTLPDDRPITSICIVENIENCPKGYSPVARTHDQDSDADLWRETGFFGRKSTRYLCISKLEGTPGQIVQCVAIFGEKENPPTGFNTVLKTFDTAQKAWRKRQLCFKYSHYTLTSTAVTDIIVLSRNKKAPEEFSLCGEINGVLLCYKLGSSNQASPSIPYNLSPDYQNVGIAASKKSPVSNNNEYEILLPTSSNLSSTPQLPQRHNRMAPKPPVQNSNYATISTYTGLDGIPFVLNSKFQFAGSSEVVLTKPPSRMVIEKEFEYDFRIERQS